MASKVFDDLEMARLSLEVAPPVSVGAFPIGKQVQQASDDDLVSTEEAGELLGISRYRINAMIVNGVLAGDRDGASIRVSRASIQDYLKRKEKTPDDEERE
jgi:excisionase family DNA binding protein